MPTCSFAVKGQRTIDHFSMCSIISLSVIYFSSRRIPDYLFIPSTDSSVLFIFFVSLLLTLSSLSISFCFLGTYTTHSKQNNLYSIIMTLSILFFSFLSSYCYWHSPNIFMTFTVITSRSFLWWKVVECKMILWHEHHFIFIYTAFC